MSQVVAPQGLMVGMRYLWCPSLAYGFHLNGHSFARIAA